jgi:hypothetical protein
MRTTTWLGGVSLLLALGARAGADNVPYTAVVTKAEAEVRCGRSNDPQLYPTNRLPWGAHVQVLEEFPDGWLAIRPPENSFSYINTRFIVRASSAQPHWVVMAAPRDTVPVLIGSEVVKTRPTVEGTRLPRGALVVQLPMGRVQVDTTGDEGSWLPIVPPEGEVRYIRAEAVARTNAPPAPVNPARVVHTPEKAGETTVRFDATPVTPVTPGTSPSTGPARDPTPGGDIEGTWQRAQQAERAGNVAEALRLYDHVAADGINTHHDLAVQAVNRAYWLRQNNGAAGAGSPFRPASEGRPAPEGGNRFHPLPAEPTPPPTVRLAAPSGQLTPAREPAASSPGPSPTAGPAHPAPAAAVWSTPGRLRRAGRALESRRTYVLETSQGLPMMYVTPEPGIDLEPYVNQNVQLFGPAIYHGELRANYMTVTQVQPLP